MLATGWTPGQVADLDWGQLHEYTRQMGIDARIDELRGRVSSGEISAEAAQAGVEMIVEEG